MTRMPIIIGVRQVVQALCSSVTVKPATARINKPSRPQAARRTKSEYIRVINPHKHIRRIRKRIAKLVNAHTHAVIVSPINGVRKPSGKARMLFFKLREAFDHISGVVQVKYSAFHVAVHKIYDEIHQLCTVFLQFHDP